MTTLSPKLFLHLNLDCLGLRTYLFYYLFKIPVIMLKGQLKDKKHTSTF